MKGTLYVVGLGPGDAEHLTPAVAKAVDDAAVIVGYRTYVNIVRDRIAGKTVLEGNMGEEVQRCKASVTVAKEGKRVVLVSSGDPGIYAMAGVIFELLEGDPEAPEVVILPGVPAVCAAAAVLGAPLMHDFACISLSDLLTPWHLIAKRLRAAAEADFVIALYNPRSSGRPTLLKEALEIIAGAQPLETPVGIVRRALRGEGSCSIGTLADCAWQTADMLTTVIVGNSCTRFIGEKMVTPRGYAYEGRQNPNRGKTYNWRTAPEWREAPGVVAVPLSSVAEGEG